jgi:hypothetical protein
MIRRSFAKSNLLAIAVGLAALGSTLTPAAAHSMFLGNFKSVMPYFPAERAPGASMHPGGSTIHLPPAETFAGVGTRPGKLEVPMPAQVAGVGTQPGKLEVPMPANAGVGTKPGKLEVPMPAAVAGVGTQPGKLEVPMPAVAGVSNKPGKLEVPMPVVPIDNICPLNPFKCPPKAPAGPGTTSNPPTSAGSTPTTPGGTYPTPTGGGAGGTYPSPTGGGAGPVLIVTPPTVVQSPPTVVQLPRPVVTATNVAATNAAPVAAAPCNCLTKQYLRDGSVLFTDICTREAAMATPDELKAQAQAVAPTAR